MESDNIKRQDSSELNYHYLPSNFTSNSNLSNSKINTSPKIRDRLELIPNRLHQTNSTLPPIQSNIQPRHYKLPTLDSAIRRANIGPNWTKDQNKLDSRYREEFKNHIQSHFQDKPSSISNVLNPTSQISDVHNNSFFPITMLPAQKENTRVVDSRIGVDPAPRKPKAKMCQAEGCSNLARSKGLCRTHGGGKRCSYPNCTKSAQARKRCIAHGGGTPCRIDNCMKSAQSRGLCKAHGGGVRCKFPDCSKSSQSNGFCRTHGGGVRCRIEGCSKWVQKQGLCIKHGKMELH